MPIPIITGFAGAAAGGALLALAKGIGDLLDNPFIRLAVAFTISVVFFSIVVGFLPSQTDWPIPDEVSEGIEWMIDGLYVFDWLIPVSTMIYSFVILIVMDFAFASIKLVMWLKKHLTQVH